MFLSARPHVYKDVSEKINFKKFEKLLQKRGMHTMPSLLAGDVNSGLETLMKNDFEPLGECLFCEYCVFTIDILFLTQTLMFNFRNIQLKRSLTTSENMSRFIPSFVMSLSAIMVREMYGRRNSW